MDGVRARVKLGTAATLADPPRWAVGRGRNARFNPP